MKIHISVMICFLNIDFQNLQEFDYLRLASVAHGKEACDSWPLIPWMLVLGLLSCDGYSEK